MAIKPSQPLMLLLLLLQELLDLIFDKRREYGAIIIEPTPGQFKLENLFASAPYQYSIAAGGDIKNNPVGFIHSHPASTYDRQYEADGTPVKGAYFSYQDVLNSKVYADENSNGVNTDYVFDEASGDLIKLTYDRDKEPQSVNTNSAAWMPAAIKSGALKFEKIADADKRSNFGYGAINSDRTFIKVGT